MKLKQKKNKIKTLKISSFLQFTVWALVIKLLKWKLEISAALPFFPTEILIFIGQGLSCLGVLEQELNLFPSGAQANALITQ